MRIEINHKFLSDSPYSGTNKSLFGDPHESLDDLTRDIIYGSPTCYLISGYRGSGKSSLVKRLESRIKELAPRSSTPASSPPESDPKDANQEIVFIHSNFSRHDKQTYLLRRLIRGLYLGIKDLESFSKENLKQHKASLERLYDKTFYDTSQVVTDNKKSERTTSTTIDRMQIIGYVGAFVFAIIILFNIWLDIVPDNILLNLFSLIALAFIAVQGFISHTETNVNNDSNEDQSVRTSMYDDEIADYHFFTTLDNFKSFYKVVFVLDELDKVDDSDIDDLLKEMKPYLVSGSASFLVVAGQDLYFKYLGSKKVDDSVLSSIFSQHIHVPLLPREDLRQMFKRTLTGTAASDEEHMNMYIDKLVLEARKLPRLFIGSIREALIWEGSHSYLDLPTKESLQKFSTALALIEKLDEEEVIPLDLDDPTHDYVIMSLLIASNKIFEQRDGFDSSTLIV